MNFDAYKSINNVKKLVCLLMGKMDKKILLYICLKSSTSYYTENITRAAKIIRKRLQNFILPTSGGEHSYWAFYKLLIIKLDRGE